MLRILLCLLSAVPFVRAEYFLKDGDTLAFLGDSITAARGYTKIVEHYTLMRFPERNIRFLNAGQGGDTAHGSLSRLDHDVFGKGATVVTVVFGINDIGWGTKADDEHRRRYLDGIRTIILRCREKNVRPVICSPAITAEDPGTAEKGYLQIMTDEGLALAREMGAATIDLQRGMREIQRRILEGNRQARPEDAVRLHVKDGVHLDELGQLAMAYAMLKGLGAPAEVSAVEVDTAPVRASGKGCLVKELDVSPDAVKFTRLDEGLPLNLGALWQLQHRWIPFPEGLNGYRLTIRNLPAGEYEMKVDGRSLGKAAADQLARGINIASSTASGWDPGGPWHVQSWAVKQLVDARDNVWAAGMDVMRFGGADPAGLSGSIAREEDAIVALQRQAAKPQPYRFEIQRVKP